MTTRGVQVSNEPINFEYVGAYKRIPSTIPFCPITITGSGDGKSRLIKPYCKFRLANSASYLSASTPVGLCGVCLDGLVPSYRSNRLVCLLRCGHYYHSGCLEKLYQRELNCPSCQADTVRFFQCDYSNVRRIMNRYQDDVHRRQTSLRSETAK